MDLIGRISQAAKELGIDGSIVELADRLINDQRPRLENAYLFSNTSDNEQSSFEGAKCIKLERLARTFWVSDGKNPGFPGYENWREGLGKFVGYENIRPVPLRNPLDFNTQTESAALVCLAAREGRNFWYAVSNEFHLLRAFMTLASEILHGGQDISVFSFPGAPLPWDEVVVHSQGTLVATRAELLAVHELGRIKTYTNILPAKDILNYMDRRTLPITTTCLP